MRAYEGYFEDGRFEPKGQVIRGNGRRRAVLTLVDAPGSDADERLEEFDRISVTLRSEPDEEPSSRRGGDSREASYALGADVLASFIRGSARISDSIREIVARGHSIVIPPTVFFEIRRGFLRKPSPAREGTFDCVCALFPVGEMSVSAWERAAKIYADNRTAGYPITDIITAAFCVAGGHKLLAVNQGRFAFIDGLSLADLNDASCN
jgi:predicted nucleic acid-binding protein